SEATRRSPMRGQESFPDRIACSLLCIAVRMGILTARVSIERADVEWIHPFGLVEKVPML
ncbi:MAG: hypothetical protein KKH67_11425, partial [candidate division Zixibacteria bacterium]|nr:hypothetical protein [candidate division Zixibacteria bacterium]